MNIQLDKDEVASLMDIAWITHNELWDDINAAEEELTGDVLMEQAIQIAEFLEAFESKGGMDLTQDIIYLLGMTAKKYLISWDEDEKEILHRASGSWYSVSAKLDASMKAVFETLDKT